MSERTVLVVDDDESIREVAILSLEVYGGWEVLSAEDGPGALDQARAHVPDAILLDFMMPVMDGLTAFRHLQADTTTRHIPVILVTAKSHVGSSQPWDGSGIVGVIPKPFDPRTLAREVSHMLHWSTDDLPSRSNRG